MDGDYAVLLNEAMLSRETSMYLPDRIYLSFYFSVTYSLFGRESFKKSWQTFRRSALWIGTEEHLTFVEPFRSPRLDIIFKSEVS